MFKKAFKRFFLLLLIFVLGFMVWNYEITIYGIRQGYGQLKIIFQAEPLEHFLTDSNFPEEKKEKIRLIQEIRQFTIDSLGLDHTKSYTKMYDQKGKPLLWTITACRPYALEAKQWEFPILGAFSYKGFFEKSLAEQEAQVLKDEDWDVRVGEVSAWSTLGILNDPILSSMLNRNVGSLTQLVIHELTHGTLYAKNSVAYNENLADFVGDEGAKRFLKHKYGEDSKEYQYYMTIKEDRKVFSNYILQGANRLDSLYQTFDENTAVETKKAKKEAMIQEICEGVKVLTFYNQGYLKYFDDYTPNNTFFMSYKRYREKQNDFAVEFEEQFDSNFEDYMDYLKETYPTMF